MNRRIFWALAAVVLISIFTGCSGSEGSKDAGPDAALPDASVSDAGPTDVFTPPDSGHFAPLSCPDVKGTDKNLRQKAEYFDRIATEWHTPAGQNLFFNVWLKDDLKTFDKVGMSDNVGLWSSMYAASQAYRYAATGSGEALENLRRIIRGEHNMMKITGVPGLFTRVYINPALPGFPTAESLKAMYPDCDLKVAHCKRFNEVTEGEFAGLWFKNDVSKDEYSGHMFTMAVVWELIADGEIRGMVRDIALQVGDHLIDNQLRITDIDGVVTTFGKMYALSFEDYPGFNAVLSLSWLRLAATVGGGRYEDFYKNCLLQKRGKRQCIKDEDPAPYTDYFDAIGLDGECQTNWNNHNMAQLSMYHLIRNETDPAQKTKYRAAFRDNMWAPDDPFPMRDQKKTLYTMFYLVNRDPADQWPEASARDAICTMKIFPETKEHKAVDTVSKYQSKCLARGGDPMADVVIPIDEVDMDNFLWTGNPYELEQAPAEPKNVESPEDYLLAYWMGRYFGFISEDM